MNYHTAFLQGDIVGTPADASDVEVALYGFDLGEYLARGVEVAP